MVRTQKTAYTVFPHIFFSNFLASAGLFLASSRPPNLPVGAGDIRRAQCLGYRYSFVFSPVSPGRDAHLNTVSAFAG